MPEWFLPLLGAIFAGGGVAGVITALNERKKSNAEADKYRTETETAEAEAQYIPGEKLIALAERAANIVSTKYESVMERQDKVILRQSSEINSLKEEVEKLKVELEKAKLWQEELEWHRDRVLQLEIQIRSYGHSPQDPREPNPGEKKSN